MPASPKLAKEISLDERNHVEKPFLDQLDGLGWQIIDCDSTQKPSDTFRESFTEVVMLPVLRPRSRTTGHSHRATMSRRFGASLQLLGCRP